MAKKTDIIILSGLSGSGKSTALRTLEDLGFFCVDNLPILLLPMFIELCQSSTFEISRVALVMDVRERSFLKDFKHTYEKLLLAHLKPVLIFLDCEDSILVQRFSETRRQHPLSEGGTVLDGIMRERVLLNEIQSMSDHIIDTSQWNIHELKKTIENYFNGISKRDMALNFLSFGFKFGVPHEADIVIDVRFMPNPYFVPELKNLTGNNDSVSQYVLSRQEAREFVDRLRDFLLFQLPLFEREGKSYLTVAIGCTGGKHRSVAVVNILKAFFLQHRTRVSSQHRDIDKE